MRFDIMTLFPELCDRILSESIIGRAQAAGLIEVHTHNIRDYSKSKHHNVDDTPYGGGMGMVMAAPPIYDCWRAILDEIGEDTPRRTLYMSPKGSTFTQDRAMSYARSGECIIILCGHYEGVDQRVIDEIIDEEISIGDFVLTGGELPACVVVDATARLIDGVLTSPECYEGESIASGLLEYPQYTRPYEFHGAKVPDVLISGHHGNIDKWREEQAIAVTRERRPDLYEKYIGKEKKA